MLCTQNCKSLGTGHVVYHVFLRATLSTASAGLRLAFVSGLEFQTMLYFLLCANSNLVSIVGAGYLAKVLIGTAWRLASDFHAYFLAPMGIWRIDLKKYGEWAGKRGLLIVMLAPPPTPTVDYYYCVHSSRQVCYVYDKFILLCSIYLFMESLVFSIASVSCGASV